VQNISARGALVAYAEFSIYPFVTDRLEPYVTAALIEAKQSGLVVEVGPLGTIMRGDLAAILELLRRIQEVAFRYGAGTVVTRVATTEPNLGNGD
jgi:uncharacterized protein YqgV (UPF0045/DUF77 family)